MQVSGPIVGQIITILLAAQMRGWIDLRGIEPLIKVIVESDNAPAVKGLLKEIIELIERSEQGHTTR